MNIVAHIRELVVEGDAAFDASEFRLQLTERLEALCKDHEGLGALELPELIVRASSGARAAAEATALAVVEQLRRAAR